MMQLPGAIGSAFFDIDGTLVDSNHEHAQAWVDALAEFARPHTYAEIRPLIGLGTDKLLAELGIDLRVGDEPYKALTARRKAIFLDQYIRDVRAFEGSRALVQMFKRLGLQCVIASSASPEELGPLLEIADITRLFDHTVTPDEVKATKPDPDVIMAALEWSQKRPEQAVMIGDTQYDIEAARRAGVRCIGLRCGGAADESLVNADIRFESPSAFLRALQTASIDDLVSPTLQTHRSERGFG